MMSRPNDQTSAASATAATANVAAMQGVFLLLAASGYLPYAATKP